MNVQELRIGNWIYAAYSLRPVQVTGIHKEEHDSGQMNYHILYEDDSRYWETIRAIPLHVPILEKVGFKIGNDIWLELSDGRYLCFKPDLSECYLHFESEVEVQYFTLPNVKYVHQLQNLYYALEGTELNIEW
jgi:hypothetical protein